MLLALPVSSWQGVCLAGSTFHDAHSVDSFRFSTPTLNLLHATPLPHAMLSPCAGRADGGAQLRRPGQDAGLLLQGAAGQYPGHGPQAGPRCGPMPAQRVIPCTHTETEPLTSLHACDSATAPLPTTSWNPDCLTCVWACAHAEQHFACMWEGKLHYDAGEGIREMVLF